MIEKITEFFEMEIRQTERWLKSEWCRTPKERTDSVWYATQRCLGVAQFVQTACDVTFEEVEPLYEATREKLEKLLENY